MVIVEFHSLGCGFSMYFLVYQEFGMDITLDFQWEADLLWDGISYT